MANPVASAAQHCIELVRIPSVSTQSNRLVIDYANRCLQHAGWQSREVIYHDAAGIEKVNLVAAPSGADLNQDQVALAFVCHTDTVPFASTWKHATDPYESSGFVHGCGACDVKGFLAALLAAVSRIDATLIAHGTRIILTADEEIGCIGAARLLAASKMKIKRAVVGEPTSLRPARAGKGYALAEITVHGKEAHSALPAKGVSAIYHAARLIAAIEKCSIELASQHNPIFDPPYTTINIGRIEGGTAKNIIAGLCRFLVEWRPIPNQPPDAVFKAVNQISEEMRSRDATFRCTIELLRQQLGFETAAIASLVQQVESFCGTTATSIPFGSEASLLAPIADEVIVFGPGDMQTAHSDRECVPIAELQKASACLEALLRSRTNR